MHVCSNEITKARDHRDLSLENYRKGNKKNWYRYNSSKRNTRENVSLLLNGNVDLYKKPQRSSSSPWLLHFFLLPVSNIPHTGSQEEAPEKGKLILCEGGGEHLDKWDTHVPGTWWEAPTSAQGADQCHCEASLDHLWKIMVIRGSFHLKGKATVGANIFKGWITFLPFWDGTQSVFQTSILAHSLHCINHKKVLVRRRSSLKHFFLSGKLTSNGLPEVRDKIYFTWTQSCWVLGCHSSLESCSYFHHVQLIRTIKLLQNIFTALYCMNAIKFVPIQSGISLIWLQTSTMWTSTSKLVTLWSLCR